MTSKCISFLEDHDYHHSHLPEISKIYLLKSYCIDYFPNQFIITTKSGSYKFNKDILKDSCSTIQKLLKVDPDALQYHIDINDEKNVMSKFEDLFAFKDVFFDLNDSEIIRKIVKALDLISCPECMKPGSLDSINNPLKMDKSSLNYFLESKVKDTLTIVFNGKEYLCNLFGVYSSEKISKFHEKDPKNDKYVYNFDDEGEFDFTIIQDLFNFKVVDVTANNMNTFLKIAEDLQIKPIIHDLKKFIEHYENTIQKIDDKIINRINEIFDWLYHIKEITVEKVADNIIKSDWARSKDDIQELISIILQVIQVRYSLHPYLLDLLFALDRRSKDENQLKILIQLFVKRLMFSIEKSRLYCSFMYRLTKKGIVQMEDVIDYIYNNVLYSETQRSRSKRELELKKENKCIIFSHDTTQNIFSWFLPEILEKAHLSNYIFVNRSCCSDIEYLLNYEIEDYKKMRDSGEPNDEITNAILHDDVEKLQSIVIHNKIDINKRKIPRNIFQLSNNEEKSLINYAAECSSLKCFKYLFLNHANFDDESLSHAIYGGNTEIIRIIDKNGPRKNIKGIRYLFIENYLKYSYKNNIGEIGPFITSIITHQNDIFDWLLEHYELTDHSNCLFYSILSGNVYSYLCFVYKGYDFNEISKNKEFLELASDEGFYNYMQLLQSTLKLNEHFKKESCSFFELKSPVNAGNLSILKLHLSIGLDMNASLSLKTAIKRDYDDIVYYLVDNVYNPNYKKDIIDILSEAASKETTKYFNYIEKKHKLKEIMLTLNVGSNDFLHILRFSKNIEVFHKLTDFILDNFANINFTEVFLNVSEEMRQYLIDKKVILDVSSLINNSTAMSLSNGKKILKLINDIENLELRKYYLQKSLNNAIQIKNKNIVELFLKFVEPNYESLIYAIKSHDLEIVNYILKFNSESSYINHIDQYGTPLNIAVFEGDSHIVKRLLSIPNINPNLYDKNSVTPLMIAISRFNIEILNIFIDYFGDDIQNQIWQINDGMNKILHRLSKETSKLRIKSNKQKNHYAKDVNRLNQFYRNKSEDISAVINRLIEIKNVNLNCHVKRYTLLTYACEVNDIELLKKLILKKVDVNSYSPINGNTPLITAIEANKVEIAEILIKNQQTDINHKNMNNKTALVIAVENKLDAIVKLLLNDPKFDPKESLLDYAFYISSGTIAQQLYEVKSLNVNYLNLRKYKQNNNESVKGYETTLINAVNKNQMKKIDMIVNHPSFDPNLSNVKEAIFESVKINSKDIFEYLLNIVNNDVNIYNHRNQSLLFYSVIRGNRDFLQLILNHDSFDPQKNNLFDLFMKAPYLDYDFCKFYAKVDIMNYLLEYYTKHSHLINFNELLPNGKSFFTSINPKITNLKEVVQFYLNNNVDPNAPDRYGTYPLEYAILKGSEKYVKYLLNSNRIDLSIRIKRNNNESFLHLAARSNNKNILDTFLNRNLFDVNVTDDLGETPLMKACSVKNKGNVICIFNSNDLDYNRLNNMGDDALTIARKNCDIAENNNYFSIELNGASQEKEEYLDNLLKYF